MGWSWAEGTPTERANCVRAHGRMKGLRFLALCRLFNLTADGAWEILRGDDWRPEYDMDAERERRLKLIRQAVQARTSQS